MDPIFYKQSIDSTYASLETSKDGLTSSEASKRLEKYGLNEIKEKKNTSIFLKFIYQFKSLMVIILIIAAIISGIIGEVADMAIILFVVILNAVLGVVQEDKAEKSLEALKKMSQPYVSVLRDNKSMSIQSNQLVVGDIVYLEAGDFVPADLRLIESATLKIEEAALTGESLPVLKDANAIFVEDKILGDRINMAYSGCSVLYGRGSGIVTKTGMNTQVGNIASMLDKEESNETPLQKKLASLGKYISIGVVAIAIVMFLIGIFEGRDPFDMFLTAISLAVAAIPEGLLAIVTIVLALGVQKMSKKNAIIRKLPAVETLGSTQIICSDKTGTLTQNRMTVKEVMFNGIHFEDLIKIRKDQEEFDVFLKILTQCNDTKTAKDGLLGDPTETALVTFANNYGYNKTNLDKEFPRFDEKPFDSERKLMSTFHHLENRDVTYTKGAPDILIEKCNRILINGQIQEITKEHLDHIKKANETMSLKALRVLAAAFDDDTTTEESMIFVGLVGMIDPPREEAFEAVSKCKKAGISPIMITGDHHETAYAIAKTLGIVDSLDDVITGQKLDSISDEDFYEDVTKYKVYARVSPEHKVRIVKAWKKRGKIVAMTGDGVNDAPALKSAHIGVGMGITGTEVSKSVSDMILTDDNFATIVFAVEEGRKIFSNIQKSVQFLLSANIGEVLTLFIATILNWTILLPIHILWINLVTDTLPAVALGLEKAESNVMDIKPKATGSFFSDGLTGRILYQGILEAIIVLSVFFFSKQHYGNESNLPMTMAFVTLGLIQLNHTFNVRSNRSIFKIGFFSNKYVTGAVIISAILQIGVVMLPFLNGIFKVSHLNLIQWITVFGASLSIILIVEVVKWFEKLKNKRKG